MLRSLEQLLGYQIAGAAGHFGTVSDFLFLDNSWTVRYVVVTTGSWMNRRRVLLSTGRVTAILDSRHEFRVDLSPELLDSSPDIEADRPVARQKEVLMARHHGRDGYRSPKPFPGVGLVHHRTDVREELEGSNPHLRSFREVTSYSVEGAASRGYLTDMILNDAGWRTSGLVVSKGLVSNSDPVTMAPQLVEEINWTNRVIRVSERLST